MAMPKSEKFLRDLSVVIPTYNEAENIGPLILKIEKIFQHHGINGEIIIVDDNSPDGTADVVKRYLGKFDNIRILERKAKLGLGYAYKEGFRAVNGRIVMEMDADFSHDPSDIPRIFEKCIKESDVVIGSRYVRGGRIVGWNFTRRMVSFLANMLVDIFLRLRVKDNTAGFRAYRREALEAILPNVKCNSYDFQVEMLLKAKEKGLTIKEIPVVFRERMRGKSKLGRKEILKFVKMLLDEALFSNKRARKRNEFNNN
ncbi:MAG: polyprenol monophosphomannose synthase [Candidatus Jordarchaeaceae archaeon]